METDGLAATTSLPRPAPAVPAGKLAAWALLVGSLVALSYGATAASAGPQEKDLLYRYSTAVAAALQYAIMLAIVLAIARGLPRETLGFRRPRSWPRAVGLSLAALAAIFLTLENKNFFGNQGQGYLLTAIASVLIGGTSIFGGRATIVGTVFGCLIIGMIEAGLVATDLTGAWVRTIQGLVFLTAMIFYLYVDEPQRRAAFMARMMRFQRSGPIR